MGVGTLVPLFHRDHCLKSEDFKETGVVTPKKISFTKWLQKQFLSGGLHFHHIHVTATRAVAVAGVSLLGGVNLCIK